jgi:hypothetical protein
LTFINGTPNLFKLNEQTYDDRARSGKRFIVRRAAHGGIFVLGGVRAVTHSVQYDSRYETPGAYMYAVPM